MALHVIFAGIRNKNHTQPWGLRDRHQGEGYDRLYKFFDDRVPADRLLCIAPYGRGVVQGAVKVGEYEAGSREFMKDGVRGAYLPAIVKLAAPAGGKPLHFLLHSGGGLPGLVVIQRLVKEEKLRVASVILVETPRIDQPGEKLADVAGAVVKRVAFFDGMKYRGAAKGLLRRFKPDAEYPGRHQTGLGDELFLGLVASLHGLPPP